MKNNIKNKIKDNKGFTLVEALIAIIILAIISVVMVQGVSMARKASSANKIKTEAVAIANQEVEKIRTTAYIDLGIEGVDPNFYPAGALKPQEDVIITTSNGITTKFTVNRSISWGLDINNNINNKIKKIIISVSNPSLVNSIKVATEIFEMN